MSGTLVMFGTSAAGSAPDNLELAALLCSRVCHDLISPVGAIVNGLEVLDDNPKPEDREFALDLIRKSAKTASARLQFCRLAFGAAGSSGAQIDLGDAQTMARGHLEDGKTTIAWNLPRLLLPKNRVTEHPKVEHAHPSESAFLTGALETAPAAVTIFAMRPRSTTMRDSADFTVTSSVMETFGVPSTTVSLM